MTTCAPSRANSRASLAPMPRAPPLMSATLPASRMDASAAAAPAHPRSGRRRCQSVARS